MVGRENAVLTRKVRGPKMRLSGFPALEPLCNAFATIVATRARKDLRTGVDVDVVGYEVMRHGAYLQRLEPSTGIYTLAFQETGGTGLVMVDGALLSQIIALSLGTANNPLMVVEDRPLTQIDITIYRRFVELASAAFDAAVTEVCGRSAIGQAAPFMFEPRAGMVRIAPDRADVLVIKLGFRIGEEDEAQMHFVVPVATLMPIRDDMAQYASNDEEMLKLWEGSMRERVMGMSMQTDCIIDLGTFSVGELSRLEQGAMIELPQDAMNTIELRVQTDGGDVSFARARLGANGRHKAVRLVDDPDNAFLEPLRNMLEDSPI